MLKKLLTLAIFICILSNVSINATTFTYTGPRIPIPDNTPAGINLTLPVSGMGIINDVNFVLTPTGTCDATIGNPNCPVDHSFVGDLVFKLTSPVGTTVTVINKRGGTRENMGSLLLDDQGGFPLLSSVPSATGSTLSGNFTPDNPLSAFNGQNGDGNWTLNVSDNANIDTGSIGRFSLNLTSTPTAADALISGRVLTSSGRGIRNVGISLTDSSGVTRYITTSAFGYYNFSELNSGETYIISITSKRFQFKEPIKVITLSQDLTDLDFIAN